MVKLLVAPPNRVVSRASEVPRLIPVSSLLELVIGQPRFRDTFRVLFGHELQGARPGWPRCLDGDALAAWVRRADVLIELASSPGRAAFEHAILLPSDAASQLVDSLLGASTSSSVASASGQPSDAECGVLAYGAARLCATLALGLRVRDVRGVREGGLPSAALLWPVTFVSTLGSLDALVLGRRPGEPALADSPRHLVELVVHDRYDERLLEGLTVGDVLISDSWPLSATSDGLVGDVELALAGCATRLRARLQEGELRGLATEAGAPQGRLEVVLTQLACTLDELGELGAGGALPVAVLEGEALLRLESRTLAAGKLVVFRGAVGVQLTSLAGASGPPTR